ncbi:MAG: ATP-binding protein [Brevundimonas sp.]
MIQLPSVNDEVRRLAMLQSLGLNAGAPDPSLQALARLGANLAQAQIGLVNLIESDLVRVVGAEGFDASSICRWDSLCNHALLNPRDLLWVSDARADPRFSAGRYVVDEPHIRFYVGVPLLVNDCMVGTLCVVDPEPRAFDAELAARLRLVGDACAAELAERHRTNAMRQALAASADALVDCDSDGRIIGWSDGAERLFGFSREEALGAEVTIIIPPEHRDGHREGIRRWRDSGAARLGRRLELPALRRDGAPLDIELWMSVTHEDGRPRVHANIRDISERRAQARELASAVAKAEEASQAKTAFLANMSHELRTPLNGVTACAGLLADSVLTSDQQRLVGIITGATDHLSGLIADILDLARIESGEMKLNAAPVDLESLVRGAADLGRLKADEKNIGLRLDLENVVGERVLLDSARFKQVLGNLLANAVKFTETGEVRLSVSRAGRRFRFEVQDTGIGFTPEQRNAIFDRFQQADATITRRFGGTGLGLAICRDIVQAMGGVMDCRSTPGEGSVFWVELDLPAVSPAERSGRSADDGARTGKELAGLRVLVTDDNDTNRQVAGLILEAAGLSPCFAENGREALEAVARQDFDLILMDMMMPEMDGVEATRRLRAGEAGEAGRDTPLIMLTANTLPEHIAKSVAAGADGHLAKPITPATLLQRIVQVLGEMEGEHHEPKARRSA